MKSRKESIVSRIQSRSVTIGVIGLGYVGLPLALAAVGNNFKVIGFDTDSARVREINMGCSPLMHINRQEILDAIVSKTFVASEDFSLLAVVDVIIICVPTPLGIYREPDLSYIRSTGENIKKSLRFGQVIILESTSYPGTTSEVLRPILESGGLISGEDFYLAFSPEREDPGNLSFHMKNVPKIVGADDGTSLDISSAFYQEFIDNVVQVSSTKTAEAVKITENIFRSVNIAMVNELKIIYNKMGIDIFEVVDAAKTKPFGYMPFYPGPGLGGHCIPIDPFYLTWKAREYGINTRFVELAGEINTAMPFYVIDRIEEALDFRLGMALSKSKILVVGVAYKRNVNDVRESPALVIIDTLKARGSDVAYFDPYVERIPITRNHSSLAGFASITLNREEISKYDVAVIVTDHSEIDFTLIADVVPLIVDTRNIFHKTGIRKDKIIPS